jgi:hypothetical protein
LDPLECFLNVSSQMVRFQLWLVILNQSASRYAHWYNSCIICNECLRRRKTKVLFYSALVAASTIVRVSD